MVYTGAPNKPAERRKLLMSMLEAVYVDTVEEQAIVAIRPKPAFQPLFEIATTREGSDVVLIKEPPPAASEPEAADSCSWWRRGRVELYRERGLAVLLISWCVRPVGRYAEYPTTDPPQGFR